MLTGITSGRQLSEGYVLQTLGGVTGFYRVDASQPVAMPAYRAWLSGYGDSSAKMISIDFTTAVGGIGNSLPETGADVYDLGGRKVSTEHRTRQLPNGVYIVDGQKRAKK